MLKKEEIVKGAIVEVVQLKKGVAGATSEYLLVTKEAGGFFDGGKGLPVGAKLEIVEGPKRRNSINTVVVKFPTEQGEYQGHVYWCELRASCKLVEAAEEVPPAAPPARKKSAVLKTFSDKQLARLPAAGYWMEKYGASTTFYCVMNGAVKYHRWQRDGEWATLMWSCCPTAKQMAAAKDPVSYEHFADHAAMLAAYPDSAPLLKSPNDC